MKKLAISTLAVLMACPAFANSNQNSSWQLFGLDPYIGIRGGATFTNLNYSFNGEKKTLSDFVIQGRAALGLEVCDTVRSEIEWSIFGKSKDHSNFNTDARVNVDTKLQTLLWNAYWEFGDYQIVRPFFGMGAGVAFTDVKRSGVDIIDRSKSKTAFSAMGTLGVSFDWEMFAVDIAARYNYIDLNSGMHNIGGDIGVRFMF